MPSSVTTKMKLSPWTTDFDVLFNVMPNETVVELFDVEDVVVVVVVVFVAFDLVVVVVV
jgi:hypothetical protein